MRSILLLLLIGFVVSGGCYALLDESSHSSNTFRNGWDMDDMPIPNVDSWQECSALCIARKDCVSWSNFKEKCSSTTHPKVKKAGCYLKYALAGSEEDRCSNSGYLHSRFMRHNCQDDHFRQWEGSVRAIDSIYSSPFAFSPDVISIEIAVNCTISYQHADTWYCSWGNDGNLRCLYEDGLVNGHKVNGHPGSNKGERVEDSLDANVATTGIVHVQGDAPFNLRFVNASHVSFGMFGYDGRFPSAIVTINSTWYIASAVRGHRNDYIRACGGHCVLGSMGSFAVSDDDGKTWRFPPNSENHPASVNTDLFAQNKLDTNNIFKKMNHRVKFTEMHAVDYGRNQEHNKDGYTYFIGHGSEDMFGLSWQLWNQGDAVYAARIKLTSTTVNNISRWEIWCGHTRGWKVIGNNPDVISQAKSLFAWPNRTGSVSMTYIPLLNKYITVYTTPHKANHPLIGSDMIVLESSSVTGPFFLVDKLLMFGPTAYFPNIPSKFLSGNITKTCRDGIAKFEYKFWLSFSTLNHPVRAPGRDVHFSYSWNLLSVKILLKNHAEDNVSCNDWTQPIGIIIIVSATALVCFLLKKKCWRISHSKREREK